MFSLISSSKSLLSFPFYLSSRRLILISLCGLLLSAAIQYNMQHQKAYALWPFGGDDAPVTAPDPEYRQRECQPYKTKAQHVFQNKAWYKQPWSNIRYANLKRKHRECLDKYRDLQYEYLKNADIKPNNP